jgi:hypothetical protein
VPADITKRVVEDREQPRLEVGSGLELVGRAKRLEIRVLDQVLASASGESGAAPSRTGCRMCDSAACANSASSPRTPMMRRRKACQLLGNTGDGAVYSCIVSRGGQLPFPPGDIEEQGPVGTGWISSAGGHVACCGAQDGLSAGDPGVAANVLVTVTSAPSEV